VLLGDSRMERKLLSQLLDDLTQLGLHLLRNKDFAGLWVFKDTVLVGSGKSATALVG